MSLQYQCPHCNTLLNTEIDVAGITVACPKCGRDFMATPVSIIPPEERKKPSIGFWKAWLRKWTRWQWSGRATRAEFWWAMLAHSIEFYIIKMIDDDLKFDKLLLLLYLLVAFIPETCLAARRLHDSGCSGKWLLLTLIPYLIIFANMALNWLGPANTPPAPFPGVPLVVLLIGSLFLLMLLLWPGNPGRNRYGDEP